MVRSGAKDDRQHGDPLHMLMIYSLWVVAYPVRFPLRCSGFCVTLPGMFWIALPLPKLWNPAEALLGNGLSQQTASAMQEALFVVARDRGRSASLLAVFPAA